MDRTRSVDQTMFPCSTPDLTASQSLSSSTPRSLSTSLPRSSSLTLEPAEPAPRDLSPRSRRQLRYHRAQAAVSSSLQHSLAEPAPVDQQIRALERATAMLGTQAREAKEQAARLRECLADRANRDPTEFETMLRERWLAAKREAEMNDAVRVLEASLATLRETGHARARLEEGDGGGPRVSPRKQAQAHANLALFLERAGTRVPLASRLAPGQHVVAAAQRRKTMSRVHSLRLRHSACVLAFQLGMPHPASPSARPLSPAGSHSSRSASASPSRSPRTPLPSDTPSRSPLASPRSPKTPPKHTSRLLPLPPPPPTHPRVRGQAASQTSSSPARPARARTSSPRPRPTTPACPPTQSTSSTRSSPASWTSPSAHRPSPTGRPRAPRRARATRASRSGPPPRGSSQTPPSRPRRARGPPRPRGRRHATGARRRPRCPRGSTWRSPARARARPRRARARRTRRGSGGACTSAGSARPSRTRT
ncbi:uncharacterized protein B0H18DRAFT_158593 [Fomitopsis serialis]|uniref:uncharacterized protein n=1 Tax=Fomitopsis serialis TaxID=139415 RepID=UPI002007CD9F|nr:uncharacterized protein B0H18DRAFT_158593 [Neoantrodia serialis]KAH9929988.1 hypothetical protein B0H18DRAFT_158593 [Neoantrodia serialis]